MKLTAEEQAKDLVLTFYYSLPNNGYQNHGINSCESRYREGVSCAMIAVKRIIKTLNEDIRDLDVRGSILLDLIDYWREVLIEIEKL